MTRVILLTDFGTADGYAAAMAGVIASAAPQAIVEHAAHDVAAGDLFGAALALSRYAHLYPAGTVHLVVVDPGVGTTRRALAAELGGRFFVAPDNGVLTLVLRDAASARLVRLSDRDAPSATFHGRDVFAPAAGRLAAGTPLEELGPAVDDPVLLELPAPARHPDGVYGEVLHVDRFGNLITNIPAAWARSAGEVWLGFARVGPLRTTYGDVGDGEPLAVVGSLGLLEVCVRNGSAAHRLSAGRGAPVYMEP
ncbi:MAG TPA: SAM-dependent chlorinase/fluorinase [Longimicrobiales bacterium]|nr:SAM-dependent chlorinase/fluorinase [Longimicrobiales bacterium]